MSLGRGLIYLHFSKWEVKNYQIIFYRILVYKNILYKTISLKIIETYTTLNTNLYYLKNTKQ